MIGILWLCLMAAAAEISLDDITLLLDTNEETITSLASGETWTDEKNLSALHISLSFRNYGVCEYLCKRQTDVNLIDENGQTALHYVVAENQLKLVKLLLARGAKTSIAGSGGRTVLHLAAKKGYVEVMKSILASEDSNPKECDSEQWTPLHYAAHNGHADIIRLLFIMQAGRFQHDKNRLMPMHLAIKENHMEAVMIFMGDPTMMDYISAEGQTVVHYAAKYGRLSMVMVMVEQGCDLDGGDNWDHTVLMSALDVSEFARKNLRSSAESVDMVKALILLKATVFGSNMSGNTAKDFAKKRNNSAAWSVVMKETLMKRDDQNAGRVAAKSILPELHYEVTEPKPDLERVKELCRNDGNATDFLDRSALHLAVERKELDIVRVLVNNGCDVTIQNTLGNTALHTAIATLNAEIVEELVKADKNLANIANKSWNLPLHIACREQQLNLVTILAPATADIDAKNLRFYNPLTLATKAEKPNVAIVEYLLKCGAGKNDLGHKQYTPLTWAAFKGNAELLNLFVKYGLETRTAAIAGDMPVHYAANYGQDPDMVRTLLDGVAPDVTDIKRRSLLHWTLVHGTRPTEAVVKVLIDYGVPLDIKCNRGRTVLMEAVKEGFVDIVRILTDNGADLHQTTPDGKTALHLAVHPYEIDSDYISDSDKCAQILSLLLDLDRTLLLDEDCHGLTPIHLLLESNGMRVGKKNLIAMDLTGNEIPPGKLAEILKFQSVSFQEYLNGLIHYQAWPDDHLGPIPPKIPNYEDYVAAAVKLFEEDNALERDESNLLKIYAEAGMGSFYSVAAAYYPEFMVELYGREKEGSRAIWEESREGVADYEKCRRKNVYANQLQFMMVENFVEIATRLKLFEGTYMHFVPQEMMEDVLVLVANNGDVLGRIELLANCMMLILNGKEDSDNNYRSYMGEKMASLSEKIIQKNKWKISHKNNRQ